jgi:hypothetical protein
MDSRMERVKEQLRESMSLEFASRYSPSIVSNANVEWLIKRVEALERENARQQEALNRLVRIPVDNGFELYRWHDEYKDLIDTTREED